ncbi:hypothetical protein OG978_45130 (plasmid) [Streptomyces sp. NBC_01591]|uniref:hypothetical protein n=1 Tax=Streptomyces sp. NBC_01591 TaxID=2975888 RepID=UPI002DDC74F4|nr:hypothetical protein [Streptomyces sp. NBC_01591]WSD74273.1 hypothetical protein OG978_45130 [Streptomyces sp. NBC_01591]
MLLLLCVSPNGRSYVVDWHRTSLLAGLTTAKVIAQDGREFPLPRRSDADLRRRRMGAVAGAVMEVVRDRGLAPTDHRA